MNLYYYVSGHGFGHISRSSLVISELVKSPWINSVHLVSERIDFMDWDHPKLRKRYRALDTGVFQIDSLSINLEQTELSLRNFEKEKNKILSEEVKYCKQNHIQLVITDSASLPISIAIDVGIPSLFLGNFTWDFVYKNYAKHSSFFSEIAEKIHVEYTFATEALILPFHCPMPSFLESSEPGLLGRKPKRNKEEVRKSLNFAKEISYGLLAFGAYGLGPTETNFPKLLEDVVLVSSGTNLQAKSTNVLVIDTPYYPDLVNACDFVITKPGYGILSECYFSSTPLLYTDRGDFAEYPILVSALESYFVSSYTTQSQIWEGDIGEALDSIRKKKWPDKVLKTDGLETIISHILDYD